MSINEARSKNSVKNGVKIKFPSGELSAIGSPQATRTGRLMRFKKSWMRKKCMQAVYVFLKTAIIVSIVPIDRSIGQ